MLPVTFGIHKTFLVASTLAARLGPKPVYRNAKCRGGAESSAQAKPSADVPWCREGAHAKRPNSSRIRAHAKQNAPMRSFRKPRTAASAKCRGGAESSAQANRPQTCHGAVKEPMRNARTATGFEPTPSKMPLCEASESLERQQASCPRHAKHKPEKRQPKTVRSQPFHMVPKLLATEPKRPNATTSRARASQKRCVRNPSTRCRNCSFEAVKKNTGKGP